MTIPEELLPVVEWWEKDGKKTLAVLALAGIAAGGYFGWKAYSEHRRVSSGESVVTAYGVEACEEAVRAYGNTKAGGALKQRLAKAYFDAERFAEALAVYDELKASPVDGYEDVPVVGRAQCLEALGRYEEAKTEYAKFAEAKPKSFLALTARIGAARTTALAGDKAKAVEMLEALAKEVKGGEVAEKLVESAIDVVKRIDVHAPPPPETKPAEEKKPAAEAKKPAEEKKPAAEAKPATENKSAEK